jgi:hypothetical protein
MYRGTTGNVTEAAACGLDYRFIDILKRNKNNPWSLFLDVQKYTVGAIFNMYKCLKTPPAPSQ